MNKEVHPAVFIAVTILIIWPALYFFCGFAMHPVVPLLWIFGGGVIGAVVYGTKQRNAAIGFFHGSVIGPFFAWLLLLMKPHGARQCQFCAEQIKAKAIVCPHCQRDLK
jgi:hypothetical protein